MVSVVVFTVVFVVGREPSAPEPAVEQVVGKSDILNFGLRHIWIKSVEFSAVGQSIRFLTRPDIGYAQ